jgi:hypothetical protein
MSAADPLDIHHGASVAEHAATLTSAAATVLADAERFSLRPASLSVDSTFGALSVTVYLPSEDKAGVDALAGAYGLPVVGDSPVLYSRRGPVTLDGHPATVTVSTGRRPGPDPARALAVAEPATQEVAPVIAAPVHVESERAGERPALALVGGAR